MPTLILLDAETSAEYKVVLSEEDYQRAVDDVAYCTQLLGAAKTATANCDVQAPCVQDTATDVCVDETNSASCYEEDIAPNDNFRWPDAAVKLLISSFKEKEHLLNTGKITMKKFWEIICELMKTHGHSVTGPQCKSKFNGLKRTYKNMKDHNNKSGNNHRPRVYFELMDEMFRKKPWVAPTVTLDSSTAAHPDLESSSSSSRPSSASPCPVEPPKKRARGFDFSKAIDSLSERSNHGHNEAMQRQDRFLDLFEKFVNRQ